MAQESKAALIKTITKDQARKLLTLVVEIVNCKAFFA
jgi:hypothetical protein